MNPAARLFVFGLGYSALAFVRSMHPKPAWVGGTVRDPAKADYLRSEGIDAYVFDGETASADVAAALTTASHCLLSVAPGETGDPVLTHHADDIAAAGDLRWIGYLSTVGVYGDHGGAWVDERTLPNPRPGRSTHRLNAEAAWRALAGHRDVPLAILRIAGIYGPGRNALKNLADGKARRLVKPGQVFNRIHVDDIVPTIAAAGRKTADGIFNLADNEPTPPQDVVTFAAELIGVAPPPAIPFEEADLSPMARSFYGDNKRVSNRRIREDLGVTLRYPSYREGLTAMWKDGSWRGRETGMGIV